MSSKLQKTVIAGEASESDDDEVSSDNDTSPQGVIQGEDDESDEEDPQPPMPALKVDPTAEGDRIEEIKTDSANSPTNQPETEVKTEIPRYDTLLHKKLRERNASLYRNLGDYMSSKYANNTKNVKEISKSLSKSQQVIQDVSHNLRLLTNDLFKLEDRIGLVTTTDTLPVINLPKVQT